MSRAFNYQSPVIAIGALPDASPNTGGSAFPPANRIFAAPSRTEDQDQLATAVQYGVDMDVAGSVDVTIWVQDRRTSKWFQTVTRTGVVDDDLLELVGVAGADIFFQLTNPAGFATIQIFSESVP